MEIDLNKPGELTVHAVAKLLRSKDNTEHRQVRISTSGIVYLSDDVGKQNLDGVACCFETYTAGNGDVGPSIKSSDYHVGYLYDELTKWPNMKAAYIDY